MDFEISGMKIDGVHASSWKGIGEKYERNDHIFNRFRLHRISASGDANDSDGILKDLDLLIAEKKRSFVATEAFEEPPPFTNRDIRDKRSGK